MMAMYQGASKQPFIVSAASSAIAAILTLLQAAGSERHAPGDSAWVPTCIFQPATLACLKHLLVRGRTIIIFKQN